MTLRYATQQITEADIAAVELVLRSPWLTQGPVIEAFEAALAEYVGARFAVAVSSGTAALHLLALALEPQEWQTSPLSFAATANAYLLALGQWDEGDPGLKFADVDAVTGNVTDWPHPGRALDSVCVPVHYAGRAAPMPETRFYTNRRVIEDACHALGAVDFDGCSRIGSCAHSLATVFSFHPVKPICTGEGGAITTNDEGLARELRLLRSHGRDEQGRMVKLGLNYRMTEMQAALGLSQLGRCDEMRERRHRLAQEYCQILHNEIEDGIASIHGCCDHGETNDCEPESVLVEPALRSALHLYPVRIKHGRRDEVKAKLNEAGIGAQVHYIPIHEQPFYVERFGYKPEDFPEAHAWGQEELSLPLHAGLTEQDVVKVCETLREALA